MERLLTRFAQDLAEVAKTGERNERSDCPPLLKGGKEVEGLCYESKGKQQPKQQ